MRHPRFICIHGHFYQPPRENPWLDVVEVQDSAAPYHDWNERITRECYAPQHALAAARRAGPDHQFDEQLRLDELQLRADAALVAGATAPEVLEGIVEADRLSRERRGGHGNALAQVYNHLIMPLASAHDKQTQVLWGIADFRHRFGRDPEGMWLAETAADLASLEALAEAGMRFTILAPHQARRWRRLGDEEWVELPGGSTRRAPTRCRLPSGRSIALFFYDGIVSRQVAFERLLDNGEVFLERLLQGFDDRREHAQLMHIATDGESYGHHHPHGDMALAYVLHKLGQNPDIRLTNYGEFLELYPPEWEVEIHEKSAWSCARRRAMELRLRLQDPRRLAPEVARAAPPGVRPAQGPARPPLQHPRPASASPTPGRRATPTSTWSSTAARRRSATSSAATATPTSTTPRSATPSACWRCSATGC